MTDASSNSKAAAPGYASLLRAHFSPIELWGILLRAFGRELWRSPPLLSEQSLLYEDVALHTSHPPSNTYFFQELVRLRPGIRGQLNPIAINLGVTLMKRPLLSKRAIPEGFVSWPKMFNGRFLLGSDKSIAWDNWLGAPALIEKMESAHPDSFESAFADIMTLSQLPHGNLATVIDIYSSDSIFYVACRSHGVVLESLLIEHVEVALRHLLSAMDAAHQRGIFHGPFLLQDIRCDAKMMIQVAGFGRHLLNEATMASQEDYAHLADWLGLVSQSEEVATLCHWIRFQAEDELYPECVMQAWRDIVSDDEDAVEKPVKRMGEMKLDCGDTLSIRSWFSNGKATLTLRNLADGPLPVRIESDQPWIIPLQTESDPNLVIQEIDIVFSTSDLFEVSGHSKLKFIGPDDQLRVIAIHAKKSYWLWPAIGVLIAFVIIMAFLKG